MIETRNTESSEITHALQRAGIETDSSNLGRAMYSTDASLYRIAPTAVAFPRNGEDVKAALVVCGELGVPLTMRGGGTSTAGNAIGRGVVLDISRYMNRIHSIDLHERVAVVDPGVVQADLQRAVAVHELRFGPDPSTSNRCTIGGMIGNNACGSRALAYGRTSDNVVGLDVVTGSGDSFSLSRPSSPSYAQPASSIPGALRNAVEPHVELIRSQFGRFSRQGSGYSLESLLPENKLDLAGLLVGSEGSLALTLGATVRLVVDPPHRVLVTLGYPTMADAADAAPGVLEYSPTACEGLDARIVDAVRERLGPSRVPPLPKGSGWLFVELVGDSDAEVSARAIELADTSGALDSMIVSDASHAASLWRIREDGAGLASRTPDGRPAYAGWEDAAVPVEALGNYLRDFDALLNDHGLLGMPYGHFGDGCIHVRLDYPLTQPNGPAVMRKFITEAAQMVVGYGGSLSGEHGDGRARGELLRLMYSEEAISLFGEVKRIFDPSGNLNPGIEVDPPKFDEDLRAQSATPLRKNLAFAYRDDHGDFSESVHKCVGVGKCRADTTASGGVMCPSYLATRNEKDSTRGRARVLQEMINGSVVKNKWRAPEVREALDLCLSCKGCATDCPTGIDMAQYKAEALYQSYKGRLRPRSHYSLGWLPRLASVASFAPKITNALLNAPGLAHTSRWLGGIDQRRSLPRFQLQTFREWFVAHQPAHPDGPVIALWVDTFTNYFDPSVGIAAVQVLEGAGYRVKITSKNICCGLTWISTGQLKTAKRKLRETVDALKPFVDDGVQIVGLEPSCTAVLRADALELLNDDAAKRMSNAVKTLAEALTETDGWKPPDLSDVNAVVQPHCHHASVLGWGVDAKLLQDGGATVKRLGGCCGLAGNFGVEKGHYEVSVAVAQNQLLPAVREIGDGVVIADGFSCRTQLQDLMNHRGLHLAQVLAARPSDD
jgi:FAD/FMN-containing dehydrogenase/Fe-S oxidoreductase